jgi:hypothetical protein
MSAGLKLARGLWERRNGRGSGAVAVFRERGVADLKQASERPFSWVCPKCRPKDVRPVTVLYRAERLHDGKLLTVDVPDLRVPRCDDCGEIAFNYAAAEQILKALNARSQVGSPVGKQGTASREQNVNAAAS